MISSWPLLWGVDLPSWSSDSIIVFSFCQASWNCFMQFCYRSTPPAPRQVILARVAGKLPLLPSSSPSQAPPPPPPPQQAEPPRQGTAVGTTADTLLINRYCVLLFAASDWMYRAFIKLFRIVYQTFWWEINFHGLIPSKQNKLHAFLPWDQAFMAVSVSS